MQQGGVEGVGHRAEHLAVGRGGLGEQRQGLVGVRGDHDGVVRRDLAVAVGDLDAARRLEQRGDLGAEADRATGGLQRGGDLLDVAVRAAGDGAPGRRPEDAEHAVVGEEGEEVARGVVQRHLGVARPHGRHERLHEVPHEVGGEAVLGQEVAQRLVGAVRGEHGLGTAVEARDLRQHPQVRRSAQVPAGRDDSLATQGAGPLQVGVVVADRHRHLRLLRGHAELGEDPQQRRVGASVVDDEAGVDAQPGAGGVDDVVGVGVPAEAVVGLVDRDRRGAGGDVGGHQAGDAGAHDRDGARRVRGTHQASKTKTTAVSRLGSSEPPSGSTVMPTPSAAAASPERSTVLSGPLGMNPAATISPSWSSQSS